MDKFEKELEQEINNIMHVEASNVDIEEKIANKAFEYNLCIEESRIYEMIDNATNCIRNGIHKQGYCNL